MVDITTPEELRTLSEQLTEVENSLIGNLNHEGRLGEAKKIIRYMEAAEVAAKKTEILEGVHAGQQKLIEAYTKGIKSGQLEIPALYVAVETAYKNLMELVAEYISGGEEEKIEEIMTHLTDLVAIYKKNHSLLKQIYEQEEQVLRDRADQVRQEYTARSEPLSDPREVLRQMRNA